MFIRVIAAVVFLAAVTSTNIASAKSASAYTWDPEAEACEGNSCDQQFDVVDPPVPADHMSNFREPGDFAWMLDFGEEAEADSTQCPPYHTLRHDQIVWRFTDGTSYVIPFNWNCEPTLAFRAGYQRALDETPSMDDVRDEAFEQGQREALNDAWDWYDAQFVDFGPYRMHIDTLLTLLQATCVGMGVSLFWYRRRIAK